MKRTTIIRYHAEVCAICGGKLAVNDGAVRWGGTDEWGRYRPMFAHPACDNPDEDNFHVTPAIITGRASDHIHPDDEYAERPSAAIHIKR
jgi:rRNA maturation protein Nop10